MNALYYVSTQFIIKYLFSSSQVATVATAPKQILQRWSKWSEWTPCTGLCDVGQQVRTRECNLNTATVQGSTQGIAATCEGVNREDRSCQLECTEPGKK